MGVPTNVTSIVDNNDPAPRRDREAQWVEHPTGVTDVVVSKPAKDSDFSFLPLPSNLYPRQHLF